MFEMETPIIEALEWAITKKLTNKEIEALEVKLKDLRDTNDLVTDSILNNLIEFIFDSDFEVDLEENTIDRLKSLKEVIGEEKGTYRNDAFSMLGAIIDAIENS